MGNYVWNITSISSSHIYFHTGVSKTWNYFCIRGKNSSIRMLIFVLSVDFLWYIMSFLIVKLIITFYTNGRRG